MGRVDKFDQLRERYVLGRRSVKWWHRIFYFLVDVAIDNSFVLWKINKRKNGQHDQLTYRIRLARKLIDGFSSRKRRGQKPVFLAKKGKVPDDVRLVSVGGSSTCFRRHLQEVPSLWHQSSRETHTVHLHKLPSTTLYRSMF